MEPGEIEIDRWTVGLLARGPGVTGALIVTNRRVLFKPRVAGSSVFTMLLSQMQSFKKRYEIVIRKDQIASAHCENGMINNKIFVTTVTGETHIFNRGLVDADPIVAAIQQR